MHDMGQYGNPQGGDYIGADGRVYNMVTLLGGGEPVGEAVHDVRQYAPKCGLVIGPDGRVYDLTQLLYQAAHRQGGAQEAAAETPEAKRQRLLCESDRLMALDRLGLCVPEGETFKAWLPFLTALGAALTGEAAAYRQALRALPQHPRWPELLPEDWPPKPKALTDE